MTATFVTRFSLFTSTPDITFNTESLNLKDKENKRQKKKIKNNSDDYNNSNETQL